MAVKTGEDFELITYVQSQIRLDTESVKTLLGRLKESNQITEGEYIACFKEIEMNFVKTTRKDNTLKPKFVPPVLDNITVTGLVDLLGDTREKMSILKKEEGYYKERIRGELIASGDAAPSPAPPMPEWLKLKLEMGDDD